MALRRFLPASVTSTQLIVLVALFHMLCLNTSFYSSLLNVYPFNLENAAFLVALLVGFCGFIIVLLGLLANRYTLKPLLIALLISSSLAAYFMDTYGVVIDQAMLQNAMETDAHETADLLSLKLFLYVAGFGLLPALWVHYVPVRYENFRTESIRRIAMLGITLVVIATSALGFNAYVSSFFREHKEVRQYFTPGNYLYAGYKLVKDAVAEGAYTVAALGMDAKIPEEDTHRELVIMVVGETARADHFSLNGYERKTNPRLEKEYVVSFSNFWSCGTATNISVPCMFSNLGEDGFSNSKAAQVEDVLDVLVHSGANVLWRDNNSSSKGVADRVTYQDYKDPKNNPVCDEECRDIGMLEGIQEYIDSRPAGDIFIVLHQMGNHGPAYYKRYPKEFEQFTPVCRTNELKDCSREEIINAYDNAILYTDYFLAEAIKLLKKNDGKFEPALLYVSDHGESLGEGGLYLHGMPNLFAPKAQRHVPVIMWVGKSYDEIDTASLDASRHVRFSHDNIFHTILGMLEIQTRAYEKEKDILYISTSSVADNN
jgi:lipid A ethanolaminephosphotransferase